MLSLKSKFSYTCTQCSQCCINKKIQLNPYEKFRLSNNLGIDISSFNSKYSENSTHIKQTKDKKCVFLGSKGCEVHKDRPLVCRLFPLGRHIYEDGSHYYSSPNWEPMPNGEYGENGIIEDYIKGQKAQEFIYFADEYFKWYCLASKWPKDQEMHFETNKIDILDIEKFVPFYCHKFLIDLPNNIDDYAFMHLRALHALIGSKFELETP